MRLSNHHRVLEVRSYVGEVGNESILEVGVALVTEEGRLEMSPVARLLLGWRAGDEMEIQEADGEIVLSPSRNDSQES